MVPWVLVKGTVSSQVECPVVGPMGSDNGYSDSGGQRREKLDGSEGVN